MLTVKAGKQPLDIILQNGSTFLDGKIEAHRRERRQGQRRRVRRGEGQGQGRGRHALRPRSRHPQRAANAVAAGAKLVLVANDADGEFSEWVGSDGLRVGCADRRSPAISGVEGRALLADDGQEEGHAVRPSATHYTDVRLRHRPLQRR